MEAYIQAGINAYIKAGVGQGAKLNQVPQGVITNKSGTKFLITKSGKYITIKAA